MAPNSSDSPRQNTAEAQDSASNEDVRILRMTFAVLYVLYIFCPFFLAFSAAKDEIYCVIYSECLKAALGRKQPKGII